LMFSSLAVLRVQSKRG